MADEPTGALDSRTGHEVLGFLQQLNKEGSTVILITHDNGIAATARRIVRLADGKIIEDHPQEVDWLLNIGQAFKMAWRSICGKKGRSALTILSIFIGIAAVMTIVSTMEGMKAKTMEQFAAMGSNRITVSVYSWTYDEDGNQISKDYFTGLYKFCSALKDSIIGITPNSSSNATVVYGTKSTANMEWKYDEQYNVTSGPPQLYYGSDQYSACNNLAVAKGRDLAWLDCEKYNQICVLGAQAAKVFFGTANPVGQVMQVNGNSFEVVGVYGARVEPDTPSAYQTDNFIIFPYTATRLLGDAAPTDFLVKAKDDASMNTAISEIGGYLSRRGGPIYR